MTRAEFGASEHAVEITAAEYKRRCDHDAGGAGPSDYRRDVCRNTQDLPMRQLFADW